MITPLSDLATQSLVSWPMQSREHFIKLVIDHDANWDPIAQQLASKLQWTKEKCAEEWKKFIDAAFEHILLKTIKKQPLKRLEWQQPAFDLVHVLINKENSRNKKTDQINEHIANRLSSLTGKSIDHFLNHKIPKHPTHPKSYKIKPNGDLNKPPFLKLEKPLIEWEHTDLLALIKIVVDHHPNWSKIAEQANYANWNPEQYQKEWEQFMNGLFISYPLKTERLVWQDLGLELLYRVIQHSQEKQKEQCLYIYHPQKKGKEKDIASIVSRLTGLDISKKVCKKTWYRYSTRVFYVQEQENRCLFFDFSAYTSDMRSSLANWPLPLRIRFIELVIHYYPTWNPIAKKLKKLEWSIEKCQEEWKKFIASCFEIKEIAPQLVKIEVWKTGAFEILHILIRNHTYGSYNTTQKTWTKLVNQMNRITGKKFYDKLCKEKWAKTEHHIQTLDNQMKELDRVAQPPSHPDLLSTVDSPDLEILEIRDENAPTPTLSAPSEEKDDDFANFPPESSRELAGIASSTFDFLIENISTFQAGDFLRLGDMDMDKETKREEAPIQTENSETQQKKRRIMWGKEMTLDDLILEFSPVSTEQELPNNHLHWM